MGFFERLKQNMKRRHGQMEMLRTTGPKWKMNDIKNAKSEAITKAIEELKERGVTRKLFELLIQYYDNDWSDFGRFSVAFGKLREPILKDLIKNNDSKSSFGRALQNEYNKKYPKTDKKTTNSGNLKMDSKPEKKNKKQSPGSGNMEINAQLLSMTTTLLEDAKLSARIWLLHVVRPGMNMPLGIRQAGHDQPCRHLIMETITEEQRQYPNSEDTKKS